MLPAAVPMNAVSGEIVLGQTVARNLYPDGEDPVGRYVLVRNVPMQVIGVLAPKGATPFGSDQDDIAVVPLTTGFVQLFGRQYLSTVSVKVTDASQIGQTETAIDRKSTRLNSSHLS